MPQQGRPVYVSGAWEVDIARRELRGHGVAVPIGGRAFEVIEVLVAAAGKLVTKTELIRRVWPEMIAEENTLQVHISAVRKAFGRDREMLKTEQGRGYRLLGEWAVRQDHAEPVAPENFASPPFASPPFASPPFASPPFASPPAPGARFDSNLPAAASDLIGREVAVQQLRDLMSAYRVVTLTGPGGIGKTSLALEVARALAPELRGDCWFVELASVSDPRLVPTAAAAAMGLKPGGEEISAAAVARAIGGARVMLLLDNCEHLIDAAAGLVETLVRACPHTSILATSREVLRVDGEFVYRVPPLDVPPEHADEPGRVMEHSAVRLFIARSQALHADFVPQESGLPAIATICRRLDGIPLAIEFAAARAATLGLAQVASRLEDRFGVLTGGRRTALPRHQTLRATLDWSYELLPDAEQRMLRHLSVFPGGFTLAAAGAVLGEGADGLPEVEELITNLITKSLVTPEGTASGRWRLLETVRAYAAEKLAERGEAAQASCRHAQHGTST